MAFPFDQISALLWRSRPTKSPRPRVETRRYKAASLRPRDNDISMQGPINSELSAAKARMDGRARFIFPNDSYANAGVEAWVSTAIGPGVKPRFQGPNALAERLHALWHSWGRLVDSDGRCDIYGLQALALRQMILTGEMIFLRVLKGNHLTWRLVPSAMLPTDKTQTLPGGGRIVQGVEIGADGPIVAYHIHKKHPGETMGLPSETVRIPARDVIHCFIPIEAGQVRGVSWLAPVIPKLHELGAIEEAELMRKKVQALFGGFVTSPMPERFPYEDDEDDLLEQEQEELGIIDDMEPGTLYKLRTGESIAFPNMPNAGDGDRVAKAALRAIAGGMGLPYHVLSGDVADANYSSIRTAMIEWRKRIETLQWTVLVPGFLDPLWRAFVNHMVLTGQIRPRRGTDLMAVEWRFPKFPWVDPLKDMQAETLAIDYGLKSRAQVIAEMGYDVEDLDREIAQDRAREARLGLQFGSAASGVAVAEEPAEGSPSATGPASAGSPSRHGSEVLVRLSPHQPASIDVEEMTCTGILSTGAGVTRNDFDGRYLEILSLAQGAVTVAQEGRVSLLNAHRRDSTGDVIGSVFDVKVEADRLIGTLQFSKRPGVAAIFDDVRDGHLRGLSVGYRPLQWADTSDPRTGERIRTVTNWELVEVSLVPVAADGGAVIRS